MQFLFKQFGINKKKFKITDKARVDDLLERRPICDSKIKPERPLPKPPPQNAEKQICSIVDFEAVVVDFEAAVAVVVVVKIDRMLERRGCRDGGLRRWRVMASPELNRDV